MTGLCLILLCFVGAAATENPRLRSAALALLLVFGTLPFLFIQIVALIVVARPDAATILQDQWQRGAYADMLANGLNSFALTYFPVAPALGLLLMLGQSVWLLRIVSKRRR